MTRRHLVLLGVAAALLVAVMGVVAWQLRGRPAAAPPPTERPFTDLETALAPEAKHGWVLHIAPRHPGPYRLRPGGSVLGQGKGTAMIGYERDKNGAVVAELRLEGNPEYDQAIVNLETPDGCRTVAGLKRVR